MNTRRKLGVGFRGDYNRISAEPLAFLNKFFHNNIGILEDRK